MYVCMYVCMYIYIARASSGSHSASTSSMKIELGLTCVGLCQSLEIDYILYNILYIIYNIIYFNVFASMVRANQ